MLLGGVTNGFESILRQTLEGKGIDFKTVLFDVGVGAATGGLFHGAGKMFEKASPFAKKAFNKVSSEISENTKIAKIALSNMQKGPKSVVLGSNLGNVDEALGRFAKEFKNVKNEINNGSEITKSQYKNLRKKTPSNDIRKMVNPEGTKVDPVYGYKVEKLEADHIVSMKEITSTPGFSKLSEEHQIEVLNLKDTFIGLGKSSNASKGAKSWAEWKGHSKLGDVPEKIRQQMLELESSAREALKKAIEERLKK